MSRTRDDMAEDGRRQAARALLLAGHDVDEMAREDYGAGLTDALTNLMHFADRYGLVFMEELVRADRHFTIEATYDWNEEPGLDPKEVTADAGRSGSRPPHRPKDVNRSLPQRHVRDPI